MARVLTSIPQSVMDYRLVHAINVARESYGVSLDVTSKAGSLLKFGKNTEIVQAWETVWNYGGDETYVTGNDIDTVSSSSTSDTATVMFVEGLTVSGTGTDAQFTKVTQTVDLNGQNKVLLGTALARVHRAYVSSGTLAGDFYVYEDDTLTGGVPDTAANVHLVVLGASGETQSFKAAYTVPNTEYFLMTNWSVNVNRTQTTAVDFELQRRTVGGVFRPIMRLSANSAGSSSIQFDFDPYFVVSNNEDLRVRAISGSTQDTQVDAQFQGYFGQIIS
jgi:hypothetical protein